uniref:Uncharacterized protein n=1 Tax=Arundo donax TaxID=35708 RepID=A0A0A9HCM1_ARUDO
MSLVIGSSIVSPKTKRIAFAVSCLGIQTTRQLGMMHLLQLVGLVGTKNSD